MTKIVDFNTEKKDLQTLLNKLEAELQREKKKSSSLEKDLAKLKKETIQNGFRTAHYQLVLQHAVEALQFYAGEFPEDDLDDWMARLNEDEGDKARNILDSLAILGIIPVK